MSEGISPILQNDSNHSHSVTEVCGAQSDDSSDRKTLIEEVNDEAVSKRKLV